MLTALPDDATEPIEAREATTARTYTCVGCGEPAILKRGKVKIAHFAHRKGGECSQTSGESDEHREAKMAIYDALRADPRVSAVQMEKPLGASRPDVYFEQGRVRVAIEVQRTNITINDMMVRTEAYARAGIAVLWICLGRPARLKSWQKWAHMTNYARIYVWERGMFVRPVHYTSATTFTEAPLPSPIVGGFHLTPRKQTYAGRLMGSQATVMIRPCLLWSDRQLRWWINREEQLAYGQNTYAEGMARLRAIFPAPTRT
jgi:hypothetical protein